MHLVRCHHLAIVSFPCSSQSPHHPAVYNAPHPTRVRCAPFPLLPPAGGSLQFPLTSLCGHHRSPTGSWAFEQQVWRDPEAPSALRGPAKSASWHWRRSWKGWILERRRRLPGAGGASAPWRGKQASWWRCLGAAGLSCSHWAGWPRSCCQTGVAAGNSWLQVDEMACSSSDWS